MAQKWPVGKQKVNIVLVCLHVLVLFEYLFLAEENGVRVVSLSK